MVAPFAGVSSDSNDKVSERKKKVVKKSVTRQKTALCGSIKPFQNGKSEREGNLLHHKHSVCPSGHKCCPFIGLCKNIPD